MGLEQAIQNIWSSDYVQKNPNKAYKASYAVEYAAVAGYLQGGAEPNWSKYSKLGQGLCEVEKERRLAAQPVPPEPVPIPPDPVPIPPEPSNAYFVENWSTGRFETARWDRLHSYSQPGWFNAPVTASPDGRVSIVNDPDGSGKCARIEIRDSDPGYAVNADIDKSEIVSNATFKSGDVRWFEWDLYLPYTTSEKFEWAHGGSQPFFSMMGFHPPGPTGWSAFILGWEAFQFNSGGEYYQDKNVHLNIRIEGGTFPEDTHSKFYRLLPLTDANGARVMANHNRWIKLKWGLRLASDSTGWFEAWVDGVNVQPRVSRPTMWAGHDGMYFKYGLYNRHDSSYPQSGRSVAYFGRTTIGTAKP